MGNVVESLAAINAIKGGEKNFQPGFGFLDSCTLHHGAGKEYPIGDVLKKIYLYEDIESIGVHGWLEMEDNINLIESGLIIGEELLYLKFETAGATEAGQIEFGVDYTTHPLYVFGIQNLGYLDNELERPYPVLTYRIHFCSSEMIRNERMRISKTYKGLYSDIVKDILENDLKTLKPLNQGRAVDTLDTIHITSPNMKPFDFISLLPHHCRTYESMVSDMDMGISGKNQVHKGERHNFVFYECAMRHGDKGGFFFLPIMSERDVSLSFTLKAADSTLGEEGAEAAMPSATMPGGAGLEGAYLQATGFNFKNTGDKYSTIPSGIWASKLIDFDPFTKNVDVYKSDYIKNLTEQRHSHASETLVYHPGDVPKRLSEYPDGALRMHAQQTNKISNINPNTRRVEFPWGSKGTAQKLHRQMEIGQVLGYMRLEITLPGISGISVGMGAGAKFPDVGIMAGQPGVPYAKRVFPSWFNNSWIITKVAHTLIFKGDNPDYSTTVEMANTMSSTFEEFPNNGTLGARGHPGGR